MLQVKPLYIVLLTLPVGAPGGPSCQITADPSGLDPCSSEGTAGYYPVKLVSVMHGPQPVLVAISYQMG